MRRHRLQQMEDVEPQLRRLAVPAGPLEGDVAPVPEMPPGPPVIREHGLDALRAVQLRERRRSRSGDGRVTAGLEPDHLPQAAGTPWHLPAAPPAPGLRPAPRPQAARPPPHVRS